MKLSALSAFLLTIAFGITAVDGIPTHGDNRSFGVQTKIASDFSETASFVVAQCTANGDDEYTTGKLIPCCAGLKALKVGGKFICRPSCTANGRDEYMYGKLIPCCAGLWAGNENGKLICRPPPPECHRSTTGGSVCSLSLLDLTLQPTQRSVGYAEVDYKMSHLKCLRAAESYLNPVQADKSAGFKVGVIVSPEGGFLIVDGHHSAMALYRRQAVFKDFFNCSGEGEQDVGAMKLNVKVHCNWRTSFTDTLNFWGLMGTKKYAQIPNSSYVDSVVGASRLPINLENLGDDPMRALGGIAVKVGDCGACVKSGTCGPGCVSVIDPSCEPFFQFRWADECFTPYKADIPGWAKLNQSDYKAIMAYVNTTDGEFQKLAHSQKCRHLPGWRATTGLPAKFDVDACPTLKCDTPSPPPPSPRPPPSLSPPAVPADSKSKVGSSSGP